MITICLNMIVRDEEDVILRCLESILHLIHYWVIIDTGSRDRTMDIIRKTLRHIPGELHECKWVNFEYNRNEALDLAKGKGDYLLLLDADEMLVYAAGFTLPPLLLDSYWLPMRQLNSCDVHRITLVRNSLNWRWHGLMHEVILCPEAKSSAKLMNVMNICNNTEDGKKIGARSKRDEYKFLDDARTIETALSTLSPILYPGKYARYLYFLGQTYFSANRLVDAFAALERRQRIVASGASSSGDQLIDPQETYLTLYMMGNILDKQFKWNEAMDYYWQAHALRSHRAEPLFRIAVNLRKQKKFLLAFLLCQYALQLPYPEMDTCVEYMCYDFQLLIEFANTALLSHQFQEGLNACNKLLSKTTLPASARPYIEANAKLATDMISPSRENQCFSGPRGVEDGIITMPPIPTSLMAPPVTINAVQVSI